MKLALTRSETCKATPAVVERSRLLRHLAAKTKQTQNISVTRDIAWLYHLPPQTDCTDVVIMTSVVLFTR